MARTHPLCTRRIVVRSFALIGLLAASWHTVAIAGTPGTHVTKVDASSGFLDSGDHIHLLQITRSKTEDNITVLLRIDDGYHINANPASEPYLIPTALTFAGVTPLRTVYPPATRFNPKFVDESLDIYQDTIAISISFSRGTLARMPVLRATLTIQACTDVICLPPADISLSI